jgi:hypothetical protein
VRWLSLGVSLLVLAVGACSSDKAEAPPARVATGLRGKLISVADLPAGFTRVSIEEHDPTSTTGEYCTQIDDHRRNFPGERVAEAQFQRVRGISTVLVNEQVTRYATTSDGERAFDDFEKAIDGCGQVTKKDGENELSGRSVPVEFTKAGDETYAATFSATQMFQGDTASISGYFVTLRARNYVVLFSMLSTVDTVGRADAESVVKKLVTRI